MTEPFLKTFHVLASTANPHAGELLVAGLDVPLASVQFEAVKALVSRGAVRQQIEMIRRYPRLPLDARRYLEQSAPTLETAIRQAFLHGRGELETNALELARAGEVYGLMEMLLDVLRGDRRDLHPAALATFRALVNRLFEHLSGPRFPEAEPPGLKNAPQIQQVTLAALDRACSRFDELSYPEDVLEAVFALGDPDHSAVRKVLSQNTAECRQSAKDVLWTSRHPGVLRFLFDSLGKSHPHARVMDALQQRSDPEFVLALLRWVPLRWNNVQQRNLRQLERLTWLDAEQRDLDLIPDDLQAALISLVSATGLDREQKLAVRQWVVRYGSPEGRMAAAEVLDELDVQTARGIVMDGFDSDDPEIQAWAAGQLRPQHVPDALAKLIDRLDSPAESVQAIARQELQSFDLECLLSRFETLSPEACLSAGKLLQKIDPDYLQKLKDELTHSIRRRKIQAARGALALGLHEEILPALIGLLSDEDVLVRRTVVEVLAHVPTLASVTALWGLRNDPSLRVREAAEEALARLKSQRLTESPREAVSS